MLDLYRCEHQQPFFTFDNANALKLTNEMKYFQEKIANTGELVFVYSLNLQ